MNSIKNSKNTLKIQAKIEISIALAMVIGFTLVTIIAYVVLNKVSKDTTVSTINISIDDIKSNLVSDVNSDCLVNIQDSSKIMKQSALQREVTKEDIDNWGYESIDDYNKRQLNTLNTISKGRNIEILTLIRKDGSIKYGTNEYISSLNNISELNIIQHDIKNIYTYDDYQYINQLNNYYKPIYCNYNYSTDTSDYYILALFNQEQYTNQIEESIKKGIADRHLGENGFVVVADNNKNIISSSTNLIKDHIDININNLNNLSIFKLLDTTYYSYIDNYEGFNIICLLDKAEWDSSMHIALLITIITEIVVFLILYFMIYISISNSVIKPLKRVNLSLNNICNGNLNEKVKEYSSIELESLSNDINTTVDSLKEYMGKEAKLIQQELSFAKEIQTSVLPNKFPKYDEFDIYACMETAKEVGGDFYDFYLVDERHLCILIADVSGKGVPAALFMMQAKTQIKSLIEEKIPLDIAMTLSNNKLCENNLAQMFVTCFVGILDLDTGLLQFVNAGHNPPVIKHNNKVEFIKSKINFVLAGMDNIKYSLNNITLNKNDELLLYTDGVTEAESKNLELFGNDNLLNTIYYSTHHTSKELCDEVLNKVKEHSIDKEQSDDITMLCIKYNGNIK